mmetsp:Transcript_26779/g.39616  ORF Transcript_26779/g.39616 Transcript_26779/m.39616 type:complete len:380 (+) Transcript_26779:51-1190(+)
MFSLVLRQANRKCTLFLKCNGSKVRATKYQGNLPQRYFSSPPEEKKNSGDSLRDTVNRIKDSDEQSSKKSNESDGSGESNDFLSNAADKLQSFTSELDQAWNDLVNSGVRKDINKKIHPTGDTPEGNVEYTGPVDVMVIDESENLTAWERMQRRLTEAPVIQGMFERAEQVYEESGAKKVKEKVDDLSEDAREAWETSQNPWVYRISSVYDTVTAESEVTVAVRELRILDPEFELEEWRQDVMEHTLPEIMRWFLEGKINQLKPWLGEGVFKRIASEITARKQEGVQIDTHVLGIMNSEILTIEKDEVEKGSPIILLHFMCQQINCVRKKSDGTVVEGSEDDIKANSYVAAFQREYNEERGELNWKIIDFRFNGAIAYL